MADPKADFVQSVYEQALAAGLTDAAARVMAAQSGIESSYGQNAPGFNYFGITAGPDWSGPTISRPDTDAHGNPITQQFRAYPSADAGIADRVTLMDQKFPGFNQAATVDQALASLQAGTHGVYYTAPQDRYEATVKGINAKYLPASTAVAPKSVSSADYLQSLQYGHPAGGVGVNAAQLDPEFSNRMAALISAAEAATGDHVKIYEGYRDPKRSAQLHANYIQGNVEWDGVTYKPQPGVQGYKASGPGKSEHNYGMATDVSAGPEPLKYPSGPAYEWMKAHAADYGVEWFGPSDPAHFQIPTKEFNAYRAGGTLVAFQNFNPGGLRPPMNIPEVASEIDVIGRGNTVMPMPAPNFYRGGAVPAARSANAFEGQDVTSSGRAVDDTATQLDVIRSSAAYGYRRPPNTAATDPGKLAAEFPDEGFDVLAGGIGALNDPRTARYLGGDTFDPVGDGPTNWFVGHDDVAPFFGATATGKSGAVIQAPIPHAYPLAEPVAPQPMPGRPAGLDVQSPEKPNEASPDATAAPKPAKQTIKVGKHDYEVGATFDQGGFHYVVTPTGIAKSRIPTGAPNLMNEIIGGVVGEKLGEATKAGAKAIQTGAKQATTAVQEKAGQAATVATQGVNAAIQGIGGFLSNPFGLAGAKPADHVAKIVHQAYGGDSTIDRDAPEIVWGKPTIPVYPPQPPIPAVAPTLKANDWTKVWSEISVPDHVAQKPISAPTVDQTRAEQAYPVAPVSTSSVKPPAAIRSGVGTATSRTGLNAQPAAVRTQSDSKPDYRTVTTTNPAYTEWVKRQNVQTRGGDTKDHHVIDNVQTVDKAPPPPQFITTRIARPAPVTIAPSINGGIPATSTQRAQQNAAATRIASGKTAAVGAMGTSQDGRYVYQVQADGSIKELNSGRITAPSPAASGDPLQAAVEAARQQGETYDRSRDPSFNPNGGANGGSYSH